MTEDKLALALRDWIMEQIDGGEMRVHRLSGAMGEVSEAVEWAADPQDLGDKGAALVHLDRALGRMCKALCGSAAPTQADTEREGQHDV